MILFVVILLLGISSTLSFVNPGLSVPVRKDLQTVSVEVPRHYFRPGANYDIQVVYPENDMRSNLVLKITEQPGFQTGVQQNRQIFPNTFTSGGRSSTESRLQKYNGIFSQPMHQNQNGFQQNQMQVGANNHHRSMEQFNSMRSASVGGFNHHTGRLQSSSEFLLNQRRPSVTQQYNQMQIGANNNHRSMEQFNSMRSASVSGFDHHTARLQSSSEFLLNQRRPSVTQQYNQMGHFPANNLYTGASGEWRGRSASVANMGSHSLNMRRPSYTGINGITSTSSILSSNKMDDFKSKQVLDTKFDDSEDVFGKRIRYSSKRKPAGKDGDILIRHGNKTCVTGTVDLLTEKDIQKRMQDKSYNLATVMKNNAKKWTGTYFGNEKVDEKLVGRFAKINEEVDEIQEKLESTKTSEDKNQIQKKLKKPLIIKVIEFEEEIAGDALENYGDPVICKNYKEKRYRLSENGQDLEEQK